MKQHNYLKYTALAALVPLVSCSSSQKKSSDKKPNIIFIFSGQQSAKMMSYTGIEEQLPDLNGDSYETTHFTNDPGYKEKLEYLRNSFEKKWFQGH